jgi:hypothetical protein
MRARTDRGGCIPDFVKIFGVAAFVFIKNEDTIEFLENNSTRRKYVISTAS